MDQDQDTASERAANGWADLAIRFALVGLALMLLMAFRPQGMLGDRDEVRLVDR